MRAWAKRLLTFFQSERGALEPIEIGVILFLIVLACLAGVTLLGNKSSDKATTASGMMKTAGGG